MEITNTINEVKQGELIPMPDIVLNLSEMKFKRGFSLGISQGEEIISESYPGSVAILEILTNLSVDEKAAVIKFIKIGTAMAANDGVDPDEPVTDSDIDDEI